MPAVDLLRKMRDAQSSGEAPTGADPADRSIPLSPEEIQGLGQIQEGQPVTVQVTGMISQGTLKVQSVGQASSGPVDTRDTAASGGGSPIVRMNPAPYPS